MFERYTEAARRALFFARYEASQLGSVAIEPEHLLLGLIHDRGLATILPSTPLEQLAGEIRARVPFQEALSTSVEIPFTNATKRALELAAQEADALRHRHIGGQHLLLGLLREERSAAASTLVAHGVRLDDVRSAVEEVVPPPEIESWTVTEARITNIKVMVGQLAAAPPGSAEALALVAGISSALDALLGEGGLR